MVKKITAALTIIAFSASLNSCSDDPSSSGQEPPKIPPASSMEMDFSTFEQDPQQAAQSAYDETQEYEHFVRAAASATVLRIIFSLNLIIPKAILEGASNIEPEFNGGGEWEWTYSESTEQNSFEVRLVATTSETSDEVNWEFYVSSDQHGLEDFLLFEGVTSGNGSTGSWIYYDLGNPSEQVAVSRVDWNIEGEDDAELELEVLSDRNDNLGDTISYTFDGTLKTAVYTDDSEGTAVTLTWDTETHEGSITAPNYNNGTKACWDSDLRNTACS